MGRRGPRPRPAELKMAEGTYRADRDGPLTADAPADNPRMRDLPEPPDGLGDAGAAAWREVGEQFIRMGCLAEIDLRAFARYCRTFDEIARLDELLEDQGETFQTDKGYVGIHPAATLRFRWIAIQERAEREFGLTPGSRSVVRPEPGGPGGVGGPAIEPRRRG